MAFAASSTRGVTCCPAPTTSRRRWSCWTKPADPGLQAELDRDAAALETDFARERTALLFSGEHDERAAILTISAGAGGTEATDWAEMLLRMYLRWAERHRFPTEIIDQQEGEQAGLKSVTVEVDGRRAYGWLRAERGVHRLVRISPFDSQKRRQTTFALVEVLPEVDDDIEIELDWDVIRVDTYRAQGAGGQHVNKTDSRRAPDPRPDRDRRPEPERAVADPEQGERDQGPQVAPAGARAGGEGGGDRERSRASTWRPAGATRSAATSSIRTRWSRTCAPATRPANTSAVLDGDLDTFMQAELERLATGGALRGEDAEAALS